MGRKKKTTKVNQPPDSTDPATPFASAPAGPEVPSAETLEKKIDEQKKKSGRARRETKLEQEAKFHQQLEFLISKMAASGVSALDSAFEHMDDSYAPLLDAIEDQDGVKHSFMMVQGEKALLEATTQMGLAQMSPEFLAKYGFALLAGTTLISIGLPRFMLFLRMDKEMKRLRALETEKQDHVQRTSVGAHGDSGVHRQRQDDPGKVAS